MHPSQDSQEGPEVPPRAVEPRDGRDLASRDRDYHQHEPSQPPATTRLSQVPLSRDTILLGPEQALTSRRHPYSPPSAYGYPSQPAASSVGHEPGRRPQWPDHAAGDTADPTLDSNYGQRPPPAWSQSPLSPSADSKTTHAQRHHPYRQAAFTPDHSRGYPHSRHLSPQEQRPPPPQEPSQPNLRHHPYRQQQRTQQQHLQQPYDQILSQEYMVSQDHLNEDLELGWQQRRQTNYNREVMGARYDLHGMHHRATHLGHGVSPLQPPVDDYGRHRHHPPSPYHPHLVRPPNRTYSPPGLFSTDCAHRPHSPNRGGGEGTSPPPGAARAARVDRHSSLPNIEPGPDFSPHAGGSNPRPYFRTSGDVPVARMAAPLDPHGRPYYPEVPPHDPRTGAPPHWAGHPVFDQRFGYYRRGYDYGHEYIYEASRRRQTGFGMASHGLAAWDQGVGGYYPSLHYHSPWSDRSPPPSWARRHSTDNLGGTAQEIEGQRGPHSSQLSQDREAEAGGGDINPPESQDIEMEDRTDMDDPKPVSASGPRATLGTSQPRTPGETSSSSEELYPRNTQEGVAEDTRRTVPGLAPSPSMSASSASITTDGPPSANPSAATRTPTVRAHQTLSETTNNPRKVTPLSPSPSLHFPSLSLNPSSSASPRTQLAVSPPADNPSGAGGPSDRKWSNRGGGETNHSGSTAEPTVQRLGQEGYYSKRDLEELYKSWRSEFEESRGLRSLLPYSPHQQHKQHQDQHHLHRGFGGKEVDGLAGGGKDVTEEGRDSPISEKRKVKWKTVEFGGSQGRLQQGGGGGEGSSGGQGRGGDTTATINRRDIARGSGDKRARLDLSREASSATAAVSEATSRRNKESSGNNDLDMDEDTGGQEEQEDDDENEDDDEDESLSEADSGSASAGDPGPSRGKKVRKGISAGGASSASDGQPRRIRIQENKSHQCNQCEKRFSRPSQLLTHSFTHSGEKPHQCPHCKRLFNVASNLKRHIRIHSNSKRRSSRNGNVVFRSFAQGTHVTQMVTGTIGSVGANKSGGGAGGSRVSGSGLVPNDPRRAVAPSPRTPAFDKLRWMNTETPTRGLTAAQQQQQQVHMASYRPIKAKLAAAAAAAAAISSSASTSSPSYSSTSATASITPSTTTTTRAKSLSTPVTPATPSTAVATPATPSSGSRQSRPSSGRDSTSTSDTTLTSSSSDPPSSTSTDDVDLVNKPQQQPKGTRVLLPPLISFPPPPPAPLP